jgi:hypothetical protein
MRRSIILAVSGGALGALLFGVPVPGPSFDFETPGDEPPDASLTPSQVAGESFHVQSPVHSDGLMHHYVVESRFGVFPAYGHDALAMRLREVAALTTIERTSQTMVFFKSVGRGMQEDVRSVVQVATNPVGTVIGIPRGSAHLLGGYQAEAQEVVADVRSPSKTDGSGAKGQGSARAAQAERAAKQYAARYLGFSAAERRWYAQLHVDPYTNNEVLRRAVKRLARVDAAASFGMRFAPVGVPFAGEVRRALDAIYNEDPAVLRKRRHEALAGYGLNPAEIESFENGLLLSPTRQTLLADAVQALEGVQGRAELLRHASTVTAEDEMEVFLSSTCMLLHFHSRWPVARVLAGLRVPTAQLADGRVTVFGAFDAVHWTADVAAYEQPIREALPHGAAARELWLAEPVSPRARRALTELGWEIQDRAEVSLDCAASETVASAAWLPRQGSGLR